MTITKIERQKKNPRRVNIFLDGEFAFGIHPDILIRFSLRTGDPLTDDRIKEIERAEEEYLARQSALQYLRHRLRTEKELRTRLSSSEYPPAVIDRVINQLQDAGYLDDRRFARAFIHDALMRTPLGIRMLRQRLRLKGVPDFITEETTTELASSELQFKGATESAKKYLRRLDSRHRVYTPVQREQKVGKYLESKGFEWEIISAVLRKVFHHSSKTIE
jgi:regulatory protein